MQSILPDRYDLQARIAPVALALAPIAAGVVAWTGAPSLPTGLGLALGIAVLGKWLAGVGRARGKRKESELFHKWGGGRSTARLRCLDASNDDRRALDLRRARVAVLLPEQDLPSAMDERVDPTRADAAYDRFVGALFERTRGNGVVHAENCAYGFLRNAYGLRPFALGSAVLGLLAIGLAARYDLGPDAPPKALLGVLAAGSLLLLGWFALTVTERAVRAQNERLADALYKALDGLDLEVVSPNRLYS